MLMKIDADDVLNFWFEEHGPGDWWQGSSEFDAAVAEQFSETFEQAAAGELWEWRKSPHGRLAEIIILDQFSRQLFRGQGRAFAQDNMALVLAQEAIRAGADQALTTEQRQFLYMPFMHSESLAIHDQAMELFKSLGNEDNLKFEIGHREVIERFGRYPTRNAALGRENTAAETAYLAERDSEGSPV
jgi:uncharacterized protein (DUF924 family)